VVNFAVEKYQVLTVLNFVFVCDVNTVKSFKVLYFFNLNFV